MPVLVRKGGDAKVYKLTSTYLVPVLGLWIIFIVWILFTNNSLTRTDANLNNPKHTGIIINQTPVSSEMGRVYSKMHMHNSSENVKNIKVMTWNLQGLMGDQLAERTTVVISVIKNESPDIVFFQELISSTYTQLTSDLKDLYESFIGSKQGSVAGYFTGIFYRKSMFIYQQHVVIPFFNSIMDRTKLVVKLAMRGRKNIQLALLTSHLESLPHFKEQRITQLKDCFESCVEFPSAYNVIFGGDLNLEENEAEGNVPEILKDLWIKGGSSEETKYTWDATQNKNEKVNELKQALKVRYDRMYFRSSSPATVKFEKLQLYGKDLVDGTSYYPSDHWALMASFEDIPAADEIIKRIQGHRGVQGVIVTTKDGTPIRSTMDNTSTVLFVGRLKILYSLASSMVRDIDPVDRLLFLRIRTSKHEMMLSANAGDDYMAIVIQNPNEA